MGWGAETKTERDTHTVHYQVNCLLHNAFHGKYPQIRKARISFLVFGEIFFLSSANNHFYHTQPIKELWESSLQAPSDPGPLCLVCPSYHSWHRKDGEQSELLLSWQPKCSNSCVFSAQSTINRPENTPLLQLLRRLCFPLEQEAFTLRWENGPSFPPQKKKKKKKEKEKKKKKEDM